MTQMLAGKWRLLAFCGVLDAIISIVFLDQGGHVFRRFTAFAFLGYVTLAAGACMIVFGLLNARQAKSWLLVLNGLACSELGLILSFGAARAITFRTIALLIFVMAVSIGVYEFAMALALRRHLAREWLLGTAGVVSVGFALVFLGFVLRWIRLEPSPSGQTFYWVGSFFAFSAICVAGLALLMERPAIVAKNL